MEKQPDEICMPAAKVEVERPVTARLVTDVVPAERLPEKVDVELVPKMFKKPWSEEVPVVAP